MPYIGNPIYQSAFVTDQFSGDGTTTAYTMSVAPAGVSNVLVAVSGVLQDPSTYGVVGNTLTFTAAPPSGTGNISCRYLGVPVTGVVTTAYRTVTEFTATASQTTFTPPSYTVGYINVYLNGVLLASTDYTATNGTTVVLATGASAGNILTVESFRVESVANAIPNAAGAVSSSNLATGAALANIGTGGISDTYLASGAVTQSKLGTNVVGNGPAFSAYLSTNQSIGSGNTKIAFDTEAFDTNSNFNTSNYRFTPTVAGYYQFNTSVISPGNFPLGAAQIWKNGGTGTSLQIQGYQNGAATNAYGCAASGIFYMNGTTDYAEVYLYVSSSSTVQSNSNTTLFTGCLIRSA